MRIPSGVTDQYVYFIAADATDFTTRETGLSSFTVYRSRNGGAAAAMTTPTINETDATNMPGVYELLLDEDMTLDAGDDEQEMVFHITHAGMAPITRAITLFRPKITAGNTLGVASDGDISGNVDGSIGSLSAQAKLDVNAEADTALTDYGANTTTPPTAAAIADAVLDEALSGHATAGTLGKAVTDIEADTNELQGDDVPGLIAAVDTKIDTIDTVADRIEVDTQDIQSRLPAALSSGRIPADTQAISGSTDAADRLEESAKQILIATVDAGTFTPTTTAFEIDDINGSAPSSTNDFYNGRVVIFTSGTLANQATEISDYDGTNKRLTVVALTSEPADNDTFIIV